MDIEDKSKITDLARFMDFLSHVRGENIQIHQEDWDNMCGIIVSTYPHKEKICFNFYADGQFRAMFWSKNE